VEFSTTARLLSKIAELPEIRQELVDQVRAEIAAGTYETEDKVDAALQSLLSDLDVEQA
jgi:negative regulator of flagellin synthesis FlgM